MARHLGRGRFRWTGRTHDAQQQPYTAAEHTAGGSRRMSTSRPSCRAKWLTEVWAQGWSMPRGHILREHRSASPRPKRLFAAARGVSGCRSDARRAASATSAGRAGRTPGRVSCISGVRGRASAQLARARRCTVAMSVRWAFYCIGADRKPPVAVRCARNQVGDRTSPQDCKPEYRARAAVVDCSR